MRDFCGPRLASAGVLRAVCLWFSAVLGLFAPLSVARAAAKAPTLDAFYKAIAAENYGDAKQLADALLPQVGPDDRQKISLAYGRVLLGLKQTDAARQYLAAATAQNLNGDAPRVLKVYAAWLDALNGKVDAAIKALEGLLDREASGPSSAEAADVLAMLYDARGEKDKAKQAVDFGLAFLKYRELKTDYIETLLRGRLKSKINAGDDEKQ
jgi:thioredoxin-like negative regulator of GroEL